MAINEAGAEIRWQSVDGELVIRRPAPGVVLLVLAGVDVGAFGDAPFEEIEKDLAERRTIELFIDARAVRGASTDVSAEWARWLGDNRNRFTAVRMLTGSKFIQVSAEFVRKYAGLGARMCVCTDPHAFDEELAAACFK